LLAGLAALGRQVEVTRSGAVALTAALALGMAPVALVAGVVFLDPSLVEPLPSAAEIGFLAATAAFAYFLAALWVVLPLPFGTCRWLWARRTARRFACAAHGRRYRFGTGLP
jgi:hypothetical protein